MRADISPHAVAVTPRKKSRAGMTLVEMLLAVALLTVVMAAVGSTMFAATQSYALTRRMQEDEYSLRLAMLSISREVHRGTTQVTVTQISDATGRRHDRLYLRAHDQTTEIEYIVEESGDGALMLRQEVRGGGTPVPFAAVQLDSFAVTLDGGRWLNIKLTGRYGFSLETTIAIFRVP